MSDPVLPLAGISVLSIEQMQALPYATQLLARLGAEVVKVEQPGSGDAARLAPPLVDDPWGRPCGSTYLRNNMSKQSVAIDLKDRAGHELLLRLVERFDVVVQNFKPATARRLGVDWDTISARNPAAVYAAVSGFGASTPSSYEDWPSYACVAEAMASLYDFKRPRDVEPTVSPLGALGDTGTAIFAVIGILAALRQRDRTGQGQYVDIAMYDSMVALADAGINYASYGIDDVGSMPLINDAFRAADGFFVLMCNRIGQLATLAEVVGRPEWIGDPRFGDMSGVVRHLGDVIRPGVERWAAERTRVDACAELARRGLAAGPVQSPREVIDDPHLRRRSMITEVPGIAAESGPVWTVGNPVRIAQVETDMEVEAAADRRPPWLGEHTASVLTDRLGLGEQELDDLADRGVIECLPSSQAERASGRTNGRLGSGWPR